MVAVKENQERNGLATVWVYLGIIVAFGFFIAVLAKIGLIPTQRTGIADSSTNTIQLVTDNMRFDQNVIQAKVGETVQIQLRNAELIGHSFDIDAINVHASMDSRSITLVEFQVSESGVYQFSCNVPGHAEAGMIGTLIVD